MKATNPYEDFYQYAYNALLDSIKAIKYNKEVRAYFSGNSCDMETYFSLQIEDGILYNNEDEHDEESMIGRVDDLREDFEAARKAACKEVFGDSPLSYKGVKKTISQINKEGNYHRIYFDEEKKTIFSVEYADSNSYTEFPDTIHWIGSWSCFQGKITSKNIKAMYDEFNF